jgi:hypothetical protein
LENPVNRSRENFAAGDVRRITAVAAFRTANSLWRKGRRSQMSTMITITVVPADAMDADPRRNRGATGLTRLWRSLLARWTGRLERRIEADLQWLDHPGVREDYRGASRG